MIWNLLEISFLNLLCCDINMKYMEMLNQFDFFFFIKCKKIIWKSRKIIGYTINFNINLCENNYILICKYHKILSNYKYLSNVHFFVNS